MNKKLIGLLAVLTILLLLFILFFVFGAIVPDNNVRYLVDLYMFLYNLDPNTNVNLIVYSPCIKYDRRNILYINNRKLNSEDLAKLVYFLFEYTAVPFPYRIPNLKEENYKRRYKSESLIIHFTDNPNGLIEGMSFFDYYNSIKYKYDSTSSFVKDTKEYING